MRKVLCWMTVLISSVGFSQTTTKTVLADQHISDVFSASEIFKYPSFKQGKVYFRDQTTADALLNYNRLFGQIQFIDNKGDSLAIANPETVRLVTVDRDTFFFDGDFGLQLIQSFGNIKLVSKQLLEEVDEKKTGAYGSSYTAKSTPSDKYYYTVDGKPRLNVGEGTLFSLKTLYFISYKDNGFMELTKKNVLKLFKSTAAINSFIKEKGTNFSNREDLVALLAFIQSTQ